MSKQVRVSLVPELRFPKFRGNEEWVEKSLEELGNTIAGLSGKSGADFGAGKQFVTYKQVFDSTRIDLAKCGLVKIATGEKQNKLQFGDILFTTSSETPEEVGYASVLLDTPSGDLYLNSFCFSLRPVNLDNLRPEFSRYLFHSSIYRQSVCTIAQGSTRFNLSKSAFLKLKLPVPKKVEQQKIADCLSSIDVLITTQTQKLDFLKAHKKGLLQRLFPVEGEILPKFRFSEFRDEGEWRKKEIETLAKRGSGHTPNKKYPKYYNGGIKWVSLADSKRLDDRYIFDTKVKISKDGLKNSSAILHPAGTVIVSRDAGVGKSAVLNSEMAVSQHFIAWHCDKAKLSNWFLYYTLQILKPTFEAIAVGNTIKTIGLPYFKELRISVPSFYEQKKIADCLSSIDELITLQSEKAEALKVHKKGLMQQLFPSIGKVDI